MACQTSLRNDMEFLLHVKTFHQHRPLVYRCLLCTSSFASSEALEVHVSTHERDFKCRYCPEAFHVEFLLEKHINDTHLLNKENVSLQCQKDFSARLETEEHTRKEEPAEEDTKPPTESVDRDSPKKMHKCNICDEIFLNIRKLAEHKLTHCKVRLRDTCSVCQGPLQNLVAFYEHTKEHFGAGGGSHPCVVCKQTLTSEIELKTHGELHLLPREKTSPRCEKCNSPFRDQNSVIFCPSCYSTVVKDCRETHSFEQPSVLLCCNLCDSYFMTDLELQCHLIEHTFQGCSAFNCYICGMAFTAAVNLHHHIVTHGDDRKPFDCSECGRAFFFRSQLENHQVSHEKKWLFNDDASSNKSEATDV